MGLPELITNDDFISAGAAARLFVIATKPAPEHRLDPEHLEKLAAHLLPVDILRALFIHQRKITIPVRRHA